MITQEAEKMDVYMEDISEAIKYMNTCQKTNLLARTEIESLRSELKINTF